jgi:AcrR family transcriptional regulator
MPSDPAVGKKKDSREEILKAATRLFGRRGYFGTTVDDITRASGISRGALYWHFQSKLDVLGAVVECLKKDYLDRLIGEINAAGPSPLDQLWQMFRFNARFVVENVDLVHCLRTLSLELSPSEGEQVKAFFGVLDQQRHFITRIVKGAQKAGEIRKDIGPDLLAAIILAIHDGILLQWTVFGKILDGPELSRAFRQVTLAGMGPKVKVIHPAKAGSSKKATLRNLPVNPK